MTRGGTTVKAGFEVGINALEDYKPVDVRERRVVLLTDMGTPDADELKKEIDNGTSRAI